MQAKESGAVLFSRDYCLMTPHIFSMPRMHEYIMHFDSLFVHSWHNSEVRGCYCNNNLFYSFHNILIAISKDFGLVNGNFFIRNESQISNLLILFSLTISIFPSR